MLEVKTLCAGYGIVPVLEDVSLAVNPGQILLVGGRGGKNGAGNPR